MIINRFTGALRTFSSTPNQSRWQGVADKINSNPVRFVGLVCGTIGGVDQAIKSTRTARGDLDIAINGAVGFVLRGPFEGAAAALAFAFLRAVLPVSPASVGSFGFGYCICKFQRWLA